MSEPRAVVFVLGAGASAPYGFPTADPLKDEIWKALSGSSAGYENAERGAIASALLAAGFNRAQMVKFAEKLRQSPRESIDAFLEWHPDLVGIGKAAIVSVLLPYEVKTHLNDSAKRVQRDWYRYLYNKLFQRPEDVGRIKTAFVTFNYDRSLDEYLVRVLGNELGMSREEVLGSIPILHPYGTLGAEVAYGSPLKGLDIRACAESIRVIGEPGVTETDAFQEARDIIAWAETICFLGFGYHQDNITRLQISNEQPKGSYGRLLDHNEDNPLPQKKVIGTTKGLSDYDVKRVKGYFDVPVELGSRDQDVLTYLRATGILDQARRQT